jgi:mono/diheme cytochrome c family protein
MNAAPYLPRLDRLRRLMLATVLLCGVAASSMAAPEAAISPQRARSLYLLHCSGCHQPDGSGSPRFGVPTMRGMLGKFQQSSAGRAFLVQAPGARNAHITDAELAALTNWALLAFSPATLPAGFQPYTTEQVSRWRANPPLDVAGARAAIVSRFGN